MKIRRISLAFFALAFSVTAFSQDTTKMSKSTKHHTMTHKSTKAAGGKTKTKKMSNESSSSTTNSADSTK